MELSNLIYKEDLNNGATGPTGPVATPINQNATLFEPATQDADTGTNLTLSSTLTNNGLTFGTDSITVPEEGTYLISYNVNAIPGATAGDLVEVAVNGTVIPATSTPISTTDAVGGSYVTALPAGGSVSIVPTITGTQTISNTGGPSVSLTVVRIA